MIPQIEPIPDVVAWLAQDEGLLSLAYLRIEVQRRQLAAAQAECLALRAVIAQLERRH